MAIEPEIKNFFKEEHLSHDELVKIVSSLQQIYLKQQDLLSESLCKYENIKILEKKIILESQHEIDVLKQEFSMEINKIKANLKNEKHLYRQEKNKYRSDNQN